MKKRTKITLIIVDVILIIGILIALFLWWLWGKSPVVVINEAVNNQGLLIPAGTPSKDTILPKSTSTPAVEDKTEAELTSLAMSFAERFGSYSNQGNFINLDDLKSSMTVKMKVYSETLKQSLSGESANQPYIGVTTKAISAKVVSFDKTLGRAEILVGTQRLSAQGTTANPQSYYQNISLSLVRDNGKWLIDSAIWQEE